MGEYILAVAGVEYKIDVKKIDGNLATVSVDGKEVKVEIKKFGKPEVKVIPRVERKTAVVVQAAPVVQTTVATAPASTGSGSAVKAPIPGVVLKVLVKEGDRIKAGQDVVVMEAMKMENQIQSPVAGVVKRINVRVDSAVQQDDVLIEIDPT